MAERKDYRSGGRRGVTTGDQLREDVCRPGFGLAGGRGSDVGQRGDDVLTASDFWGGAGSAACQGFITQLGRNFQVIYEQANAHGQKVQAAGNNMAQTDSAVGSSWA